MHGLIRRNRLGVYQCSVRHQHFQICYQNHPHAGKDGAPRLLLSKYAGGTTTVVPIFRIDSSVF